jgi:DNA mismatch endonuclease (patch repair protein)
MPDVFTRRKRSEVMSRIRGRGNLETELALARLLRSHGITGWRRQQKLKLEGGKRRAGPSRPANVGIDFLFPKQRVAVFVDGCFWHGCPVHSPPARWLAKSTMPAGKQVSRQLSAVSRPAATGKLRTENRQLRTGKAFWREKLTANIARDRVVTRQLSRQGWRVVRIWEHELGQTSSQRSAISRQRVVERIRRALR